MTRTIHRNFDQVTDAESARSALLAKGFPPASVKLTKHTPLPSDLATSTVGNILDSLTPGGPAAAAQARARAGAMLTVDIYDEEEGASADAIMSGFGARSA